MKKGILSSLILVALLVFSACTKNQNASKTKNTVDVSALSSTTPITITPSALVAPLSHETVDDQKYNSAVYQLTDAMRATMTTTILTHIYNEYDLLYNDASYEGPLAIFFDDLFIAFPTLEASINTHLANTNYGLTYEYNNFDDLSDALEWHGVTEDAAVWVGNRASLPSSYTPTATDYVIATTIQPDVEDADSQDPIFCWDISGGTVATATVGETEAANLGKVAVIAGSNLKTGFLPNPVPPTGPISVPPYATGNPWGEAGGDVIVNRVFLTQRFERNRHSEIRMTKKWGTYGATNINGVFNMNVVNLHKNDFNKHKWISPANVCPLINNNTDLVYVYNLYEYDWYGSDYTVGGFADPSTGAFQVGNGRMFGRMAHSNEYYLAKPKENHHLNLNARIAHPQCYTIYTNTDMTHYGTNGEVLLKHN